VRAEVFELALEVGQVDVEPVADRVDDVLDRAAITRQSLGNLLRGIDRFRIDLGKRGADVAEMADDAMLGLAQELRGRPSDEIWQAARERIVRAVAAHELGHLLELDPNYPGAAGLSSRLNNAFRAQAEQAASALRTARQAAAAAGAPAEALRAADATARAGDELMAKAQFAEATRTLLDARDTLDRARRSAAARPATPAPQAASAAASAPPAPVATPPPARGFTADATSVRAPRGSGPAGFDDAQTAGRAALFNGRMEFEVLPPAVRPGEPFVVRIHLRNDGKKSVKIRGLSLAAVVDGQRVPAAAKPLQREVQAQSRALVAEYSGVWAAPREWMLEAVVTADKDETVTSRLKAN